MCPEGDPLQYDQSYSRDNEREDVFSNAATGANDTRMSGMITNRIGLWRYR